MNRYAVPLPFSLRINKKTLVLFTVALLLIFIAGFRPIGLDRDSPTYVSLLNIPFSQANFLDKEPTFWMLVEINRVLFSSNERTFFLIFAIIGVSLKILAINRLSSMPFLSLWAYICLYFILHEMTQIRAGIAAGIFLLSIPDICNRNLKKFIIKVLFASLFHYSAIVMLSLYFLNLRKISIIYFFLPVIGLFLAYFGLSKILLLNFTDFLPEFLSYKYRKIYFLGQEFKGKLIFTGMIDELFNFKYGYLPYRSLDLRFETIEKEYYQEAPVVNYPNDYDFTRITEFKHIHPTKSEKTTILKEYPKAYQPNRDIPYYPVFTKENQELYNRYNEEAEKFENLILVGRLAEYKYYDMDDVIKRALEVFEERII